MAAATKTPAEIRAEALSANKALRAKAKAENRRQTPDELDQIETNLAAIDAADATEQAERETAARDAEIASREAKAERDAARPRPTRAGPGASAPAVAREAFMDDPKRGYRDLRAFLTDVVGSASRGLSPQLKSLQPDRSYFLAPTGGTMATAGTDEHSTYDYGSLGAMLPAALLPGVLSTPAPDDPFPDTLRIPLAGQSVEIVARVDRNHSSSVSGGLRVYRRAESQDGTSSKIVVEKITLRADPLMGVSFETEELLADAPGVAIALISAGFDDEFKAKRVQEIISGTGAGENLGFATSGITVDVAKETGQAAASIVYDNVVKMLARGWNPTRWIANRTCIPQLAKMNAGTNGLVWQPSAREGIPGTLMGLPIVFTEFCAAVGTVGDLVLCNNTQYIETIRQDVATEESIHVRFLANERAMRFTARRGGAPWWRSVLTPKNGDTLSPYVRLATRA